MNSAEDDNWIEVVVRQNWVVLGVRFQRQQLSKHELVASANSYRWTE